MPIKVKEQYKNEVFGFNNSAAPLGQRDDLHLLVADARFHKQKYILDMFENLPSDEELLKEKGKAFEQNRFPLANQNTGTDTNVTQSKIKNEEAK